MPTNYNKGFRCIYSLTAHLVFVCKYRNPSLGDGRLPDVEGWITATCEKWDCEVLEISGEEDHIHFLISYPPKVCLSKLVANLKTVSSRLYRKKYSHQSSLWTGGYHISSCGGVTIDVIKGYVQKQSRPKEKQKA